MTPFLSSLRSVRRTCLVSSSSYQLTIFSHTIPPGQGKPETQSRNSRRRKARQFKKQSILPVIPPCNEPVHTTSGTTTFTTPAIVPKDMANGNKRKGFRNEMMEIRGSKTVFDEADHSGIGTEVVVADHGDSSEHVQRDAGMKQHGDGEQRRHIIPPSERGGLPGNVFVTSKKFFRGEQNAHRARKEVQGEKMSFWNGEAEEAEAMAEKATDEEDLWEVVERHYDLSAVLTTEKAASLVPGALIAWKVSLIAIRVGFTQR